VIGLEGPTYNETNRKDDEMEKKKRTLTGMMQYIDQLIERVVFDARVGLAIKSYFEFNLLNLGPSDPALTTEFNHLSKEIQEELIQKYEELTKK
jgi:hypothetical protein